MKKTLFISFLIIAILLSTTVVVAGYNKYWYIKNNYGYGGWNTQLNPYYDMRIRSDYSYTGNETLPTCWDPNVGTTIPMSNYMGYAYCVDNYYYIQANKDDPYVQLVQRMFDRSRHNEEYA